MSATTTPSQTETLAAAAGAPPAFDQAAHDAASLKAFKDLGGEEAPSLAKEAPYPWEKKDGEPKPQTDTPAKGASTKDAPGAATSATPGEATAPDPGNAPKPPDRDTREKITLAKRALGRSGLWTDSEIEALPVEALIQKGEKAAKKQAADDKAYAALKGTKTTPAPGDTAGADATGTGRSGGQDPTVAQTGQPPADDIDRMIEAGDITPEQGETVKSLHRSANEKVQAATRLVATARIDAAKAMLVEKFPDLATPEGETKVRNWMAKHDPQGEYILGENVADFQKFFESACWVEWGPEIGRVTREQMLKGNQAARDGQPDHSSPRATDPASISPEEKRKLIARAAEESGGDEAVFNATMRRLGLPTQ